MDCSAAFVNDSVSSSLKKDNVDRHLGSEMHQRAISFEKFLPGHTRELQLGNPKQKCRRGGKRGSKFAKVFALASTMAKLEIPLAAFLSVPNQMFTSSKLGARLPF